MSLAREIIQCVDVIGDKLLDNIVIEVKRGSPVKTGALRRNWRKQGKEVINDVGYARTVDEKRNFVRPAIIRATNIPITI